MVWWRPAEVCQIRSPSEGQQQGPSEARCPLLRERVHCVICGQAMSIKSTLSSENLVQKSNSLESRKENHRLYNKVTLQVLRSTWKDQFTLCLPNPSFLSCCCSPHRSPWVTTASEAKRLAATAGKTSPTGGGKCNRWQLAPSLEPIEAHKEKRCARWMRQWRGQCYGLLPR